MRSLPIWIVTLLLSCAGQARAGELLLLPDSVTLDGPHASQRFVVELRDGGSFVADRSGKAAFATENPQVAVVENDGTVLPRGDGSTTLTVIAGGQVARAKITVKNFASNQPWTFQNHVLAVMTKTGCNSGACHGAAAGKNGFRLTLRGYGPEIDYNTLTRQALARRIVKTAPAESLILLKPTGALEHGGGVRFTTDSLDYRVIAEWIGAGMPPPSKDDPRAQSLAVYPPTARLKPGDGQQILVQARYSDGHTEDVTRWAKFGSTDETVAKVDDTGQVKVEGHGEAAITVWFASLVETATITSPYDTPIDPKVFAEAPRKNPIDEKNLAKLQSLGIPPSPDAGDAAFLRRAYLNATGTLPPADLVTAFLTDKDIAKRAKLVDRLLASQEYVDYWAYRWSDLFLVSTNKLPAPAMWSFYRFVRQSVAENVPWDQFASRIVTARGSTLQNGAVNYFVLHRDPIELTESTSMAFLGLSLTCARCHNHPLEKWTQDQYYGFANLFARVRLKDGTGPGDVELTAAPEGEIRHPRTGKTVAPQPLDAAALPADSRADRREALADWLAKPDNPYFTRAIVNRVWRNFFGKGLVDPEDDLRATNPPSDEALMDWLVTDFQAHKYDVKHLIRTIMTSAVYARSSSPLPANAMDTKYLSHYPAQRLPAEVLLDAISQVTGVPSSFPGYPGGWRSMQLPDTKVVNTFLDSFGRPERQNTCSCERSAEPSVAQALSLSNGPTLNDKLRSDQSAIAKEIAAGTSDEEVLNQLFRAALSRSPTEAERAKLLPVLAESGKGIADAKQAAAARRQAVEDLYWAVLTSNEFLFNH